MQSCRFKNNKWRLFLLLFLWFVSAPLYAQEKVTIQLKWFHQFQFAGYYAAIEKGFYADEGLQVELRERDLSSSHITDVLEGDAQYGVADAGLLLSRLQGNPVVLLAQIFQHSPLAFVTLKESNINTPYELAGKRVMLDTKGYSNAPISAMLLDTLGSLNRSRHNNQISKIRICLMARWMPIPSILQISPSGSGSREWISTS